MLTLLGRPPRILYICPAAHPRGTQRSWGREGHCGWPPRMFQEPKLSGAGPEAIPPSSPDGGSESRKGGGPGEGLIEPPGSAWHTLPPPISLPLGSRCPRGVSGAVPGPLGRRGRFAQPRVAQPNACARVVSQRPGLGLWLSSLARVPGNRPCPEDNWVHPGASRALTPPPRRSSGWTPKAPSSPSPRS